MPVYEEQRDLNVIQKVPIEILLHAPKFCITLFELFHTIRGYTRICPPSICPPLFFGGSGDYISGGWILTARRRREKNRFLNTKNMISKGKTM